MSREDGEKERLRATPLFTSSSSEVQDTLSFINVVAVIGYLAGFGGQRRGK